MPYQILCNGVNRVGVKASPDLTSGFSAMCRYTKFGMASSVRTPAMQTEPPREPLAEIPQAS